ncbi:hypothetical protein ABZ949_02600 [Micromonospora tulbaghiae]|uniref:hypothetical protein n=1 Tax=Micromonospora tulbaghiae TaxID=479978 RepID=UPI0033C87178
MTSTTPEPSPDYARDVPPAVMTAADNVLRRIHEAIDGAPHALATVAYRAGRDAAWDMAIEVVERAKAESANPDYQRGLEAYQSALLAALRVSARLVKNADMTREEQP